MSIAFVRTSPISVFISVMYPSEQPALADKRELGIDADGEEQQADGVTGVAGQTLRALADDDAPVNRKEPQAVRQGPHGRREAADVDGADDGGRGLTAR